MSLFPFHEIYRMFHVENEIKYVKRVKEWVVFGVTEGKPKRLRGLIEDGTSET